MLQNLVASFTDAWIETGSGGLDKRRLMSHLLQMRGLKLIRRLLKVVLMLSHLLQMRGLKRLTDAQRTQVERRIFYRCVD